VLIARFVSPRHFDIDQPLCPATQGAGDNGHIGKQLHAP